MTPGDAAVKNPSSDIFARQRRAKIFNVGFERRLILWRRPRRRSIRADTTAVPRNAAMRLRNSGKSATSRCGLA